MNLQKIKNAKTKTLGKEIIYNEEIESTQELAKEIVKSEECINGTIVICDNQTKGKGTKGRSWFTSNNKNITMTIILKDNIEISKLDKITIQIAEKIKDAIEELYGYKLTIKEPNDLLLNNKKISGILTQSSTTSNKVNFILIGIGFNVNQEKFDEDLKDIATSLKKEYKKDFKIEEIINKILEKLEEIFDN